MVNSKLDLTGIEFEEDDERCRRLDDPEVIYNFGERLLQAALKDEEIRESRLKKYEKELAELNRQVYGRL